MMDNSPAPWLDCESIEEVVSLIMNRYLSDSDSDNQETVASLVRILELSQKGQ